jgi:hypothetical protein
MKLRCRLDLLEAAADLARPHAVLVILDHPPDGRTRVCMSDGSELPPGADWREFAVAGEYTVMGGIDLDVVVGRKKPDPATAARDASFRPAAPRPLAAC